jgi:hypothetical protein
MFIGLYFYLLIGIVVAWFIDRKEMTKEIPYETFPSIISLQAIRVGVYIICAIIWFPAILLALFDSDEYE